MAFLFVITLVNRKRHQAEDSLLGALIVIKKKKVRSCTTSIKKGGRKYVMDNCCYSRDLMASWYGHFVYNGWINSYPSRSCFNYSGV